MGVKERGGGVWGLKREEGSVGVKERGGGSVGVKERGGEVGREPCSLPTNLSQFEDVLLPVHDFESPIGQPATDVPRVEPAILVQCLPRLLLILQAMGTVVHSTGHTCTAEVETRSSQRVILFSDISACLLFAAKGAPCSSLGRHSVP